MESKETQALKDMINRRYSNATDSDKYLAFCLISGKNAEFKDEEGNLIVSTSSSGLTQGSMKEYARQLKLLQTRLMNATPEKSAEEIAASLPVPQEKIMAYARSSRPIDFSEIEESVIESAMNRHDEIVKEAGYAELRRHGRYPWDSTRPYISSHFKPEISCHVDTNQKVTVIGDSEKSGTCYVEPNNIHKIIRPEEIKNVSDGYHTFEELYDHRTKLFSVICACFQKIAWKSKLHNDGTMYDGMFIVGINTIDGPATYHCEMKYWDLFDLDELETAPVWDGHTPEDAITRILSLVM